MLHPELVNFIRESTPPLNPLLAQGLATHQMSFAEKYIDEVFKSAAKDFPAGLTYAGCQRCTPEEEYAESIKHNGSKRGGGIKRSKKTYETARSDIYLMKYFFKFHGELLDPRYIYLPFVSQAGSIHISGSKFTISPVIQDRVFSIGASSIFVRFVRDKITFDRSLCAYMANGVRETEQMVHSRIHKEKSVQPTVRAHSSMVHYLFCKYGFTEAFKRFTGTDPVVANDFNEDQYPRDMWIICSTIYNTPGMRPRGYGRGSREYYESTPLKIAIRREQYTPMVKAMIGAFFYVVDHFPTQMKAEYIDSTLQWQVLMGHILFSGGIGAGKLLEKMQSHIHSLDEYVDTIVRANMAESGVHVNNLYEFFAIIIEKYNDWLLEGSSKINSMYDKELVTVYYALMDITKAIFTFYYKINATAARPNKELTKKDVVNTMNTMMTARRIFDLRKDHGEVSSNSYSGDNMAFKITSILVPQSSATRRGMGKSGDRGSIGDPSKKFHVSVAEVGSYSGMAKSDPSGHSKLNHHTRIDHKGRIIRNDSLQEMLDDTQSKISRQHKTSVSPDSEEIDLT